MNVKQLQTQINYSEYDGVNFFGMKYIKIGDDYIFAHPYLYINWGNIVNIVNLFGDC